MPLVDPGARRADDAEGRMAPRLSRIVQDVAIQLCNTGTEWSFAPAGPTASLVYPTKRVGPAGAAPSARISEAEAQLLFALALSRESIPFAVSVPTVQHHVYRGPVAVSGRTDLLVFAPPTVEGGPLARQLGVEFKAHNAAMYSIRKDLEQLLGEDHDGLWFHVLKNVDQGTLDSLLGKFRRAFQGLAFAWASCVGQLSFALVITDRRLLLRRTLVSGEDPAAAFGLDCDVKRESFDVTDAAGWDIQSL